MQNPILIRFILSHSRANEVDGPFFNWYIDYILEEVVVEFSKNDWGGTNAYKSVPHCSCSLIVIVW